MTDNVMPLREPGPLPRLPPINIEAEQHLLGAILCNNRLCEVVPDFLKPEHFANAMHARILEAIQKLVDRGQIASPVTLKATFDQDAALAETGGAGYLAKLASAGATLTHVEVQDYAQLVYDVWQRRQLIEFGEEVVGTAYRAELDNPASAQIERAESWLYRLAESGDTGSGFQPLSAATGRAIEIADAAFRGRSPSRTHGVAARWRPPNGVRFVVPIRTVHSGPTPRFFGQERGVTFYNSGRRHYGGRRERVLGHVSTSTGVSRPASR